jgi:pre-60S factor REI1
MDSNLTHMSHEHSFFIPDTEHLFDIESLLGYLFVLISEFNECLYCGSTRSSKSAAQDHMRGKGHCKLDFESEENEFIQFYDFFDELNENVDGLDKKPLLIPDEDELRLPSGKILGHRSRAQQSQRKYYEHNSLVEYSRPSPSDEAESELAPAVSNERRVGMRAGTSTSLIGVPELQQRALIAVERKISKVEKREKDAYQSKVERGGNKQKTFRVKSIGKKAGGLEKRLG